MTVKTYQRGETISIWAENRTWAGVLTSPDTGVKITLTDPDGVLANDGTDIEDRAMAESETGKYVFYYTAASDDPLGWWRARCVAQDGTKYVVTDGGFRLEA